MYVIYRKQHVHGYIFCSLVIVLLQCLGLRKCSLKMGAVLCLLWLNYFGDEKNELVNQV